jgi:hypothetical protein
VGVWGPGIFSDDIAVDVRDEYRRLIGGGLDGPEATDKLLTSSAGIADDDEDGIPFWLALAATQWKMGRLEPRVLDRALAILDAEADLERWQHEDPELVPKRRAALEKLRATLTTPQGSETKVRAGGRFKARFAPGDVISYRLPDGRYTAFRIVGSKSDHEGEFDVAELVDYLGADPPTFEAVTQLPPRPFLNHRQLPETPFIVPLVLSPEAKRRLEVIGRGFPRPPLTRRRFGLFGKVNVSWNKVYTLTERWDQMEYYVLPAFGEEAPDDS